MLEDPSTAYKAERAIVDLLIDEVTTRLTDRGGERHGPPWSPKQAVQVGVLRPQWARSEPAANGNDDEPDDPTAEAQVLSDPDVIGVDFVVAAQNAVVELAVDVTFAIYLPEYPTHSEAQRLYATEQDSDQVAPKSRPRAQLPLRHAWRRQEIVLEGLSLIVKPDAPHAVLDAPVMDALREVTDAHFSRAEAARPFKTAKSTIPVSSLASDEQYRSTLASAADQSWKPALPHLELSGFVETLPDGVWNVSVSFTNQTVIADRTHQDLSAYDCRIVVRPQNDVEVIPQRFDLAPHDYRFSDIATVPGHGRGCVAIEADGGVASETLPLATQKKMVPRDDHVPSLRWSDLAADTDLSIVKEILNAMRMYRIEWLEWLELPMADEVRAQSREDLTQFENEIETFELGIRALLTDDRILRAFCLTNDAFARVNRDKPFDSWRLFQLVYIVSHLPALVARTSDFEAFRRQLDTVDVLWFPTGGGKTEAYLGLILVAAFFDRLRGKAAGVTAWLKFPLRMLSVQQLIRVLRVLTIAEEIRLHELDGLGAPFELGFLVGRRNTPNKLSSPAGWWPGFDTAVDVLKDDPSAYDEHRLVGQCPFCLAKGAAVGLEVDTSTYQLRHHCRECGRHLPLHITDEEVYRYLPTVVVSTIDKVTGFAHFDEFTSFTRGPERLCPQHGYFTLKTCTVASHKGKYVCAVDPGDYETVVFTDPVPALTIQDELHLVREDLGAFAGHFEGLIAELQRHGPSKLPTKVLGATATIEQFENQLRQVYGRHPRRFPSPGFTRERSFYIDTLEDVRRVFLGIMPTGSGVSKVEAAALVQTRLIEVVHRMQENLTTARQQLEERANIVLSEEELEAHLFNYELSLGFVNNKNAGAQIADSISKLSARFETLGEDPIVKQVLTGEVDVPELAEAIDMAEDASLSTPRSERLRVLVGTSVVSHGVDLARLNLMVMCGLPSTTADYIQATSRSGRIHVGLVVTVFDDFQRRERSSFSHFQSSHQMLEMLVEPVPVNRYAHRAVERTLPSIVVSLLRDLTRDPQFAGPAKGIHRTADFKKWWNSVASTLSPVLEKRIEDSYRSHVAGLNPQTLEDELVFAALQRWRNIEKQQMCQFDGDWLTDLFRLSVMSSLRDVDTAVEFSGSPDGRRVYQSLFPERSS